MTIILSCVNNLNVEEIKNLKVTLFMNTIKVIEDLDFSIKSRPLNKAEVKLIVAHIKSEKEHKIKIPHKNAVNKK